MTMTERGVKKDKDKSIRKKKIDVKIENKKIVETKTKVVHKSMSQG